ncbi:MAG: hypothetical protein V4707_10790 [Pseudomonadota bacterium]
MTATVTTPMADAWRWWEARRVRYNVVLFVTGWIGWALLIATGFGWNANALIAIWQSGMGDFALATARVGMVYLVYMAAANVLFLLGPLLEVVLKPDPVQAYRQRALAMGTVLSVALPLIAAIGLGLLMWDPRHGG